jgi:hypothetical protein
MLNGGVTMDKIIIRYPGKFGDRLGTLYQPYRAQYTPKFGGANVTFVNRRRQINFYRQMASKQRATQKE